MEPITYKSINDDQIAVYLGKQRIGTINALSQGFRYYPKGSQSGGEIFTTLQEVKKSLED